MKTILIILILYFLCYLCFFFKIRNQTFFITKTIFKNRNQTILCFCSSMWDSETNGGPRKEAHEGMIEIYISLVLVIIIYGNIYVMCLYSACIVSECVK